VVVEKKEIGWELKLKRTKNWMGIKVEKDQFDALLGRMLREPPEKTQAIKGQPGNLTPIIPPKPTPKA